MYELLIVDDEVHIAAGIERSVEWSKLSIARTHVAHNMRQAMRCFEERNIDLMICDIEMPEGDGFELLNWVRERRPEVKSLFLTCHADFEYARKAIRLGSLDYLLKPVMPDKLEEAVAKAIEEIEKDREAERFSRLYEEYRRLWSAHQPLLVERFWTDLLRQSLNGSREIEARSRALGLDPNAPVVPVYIRVQRWQKRLTEREEQIMEYALKNAAEEMLMKDGTRGEAVSVARGVLIAFLRSDGPETEEARLASRCEEYIRACNDYLYCHLSCYIGRPSSLADIRAVVSALESADRNNVLHYDRVFPWSGLLRSSSVPEHAEPPQMKLWSELLLRREEKALAEAVCAYLENWKHIRGIDCKVLQAFYQDVLQMVSFALKSKGLFSYTSFAQVASVERIETAGRSLADLRDCVLELLRFAGERLRELEREQSLAEQVKRYISRHLDQELSRQEIARHFNLSPDYLVKLFKKETGFSISDYILKERMDNAIGLLTKTDMPISDISMLAGYSSFSYFSKVFKKVTGYTPQDYRKLHKKDNA